MTKLLFKKHFIFIFINFTGEFGIFMKLSLNWLKEYVDLDENLPLKDFCSEMTMTGSKVETYESEAESLEKVVTGKVLSIEKHPNAEKLVVCKVDVTENFGGVLTIATGAKNLKEGDIVPVALDGSTLPGGIKIKNSNLRGVTSEGMMCSLEEIGLRKEDYKDLEEGIFVLPKGTELGVDIKKILGLDDALIDFEITPNRPDCLSVIGLAREASVTFGKNFKFKGQFLENKLNENQTNDGLQESLSEINDDCSFSLRVDSKDLCPYYSARVISGIEIGESPEFIKKRLNLMGVKSINNVVDITNYVMLEYGQPLHAFDYEEISGSSIIVRRAEENEKLVILDGTELTLKNDDLIIADGKKPIALAGVMGGLASGIKSSTSAIVLESANFNPVSIRKSSKRHNIRTEASSRYEKGLPKENCILAMNRAVELFKKYCGFRKISKVYASDDGINEIKKIDFKTDFVNKFLNINLTQEEMKKILLALGFSFKENEIIVPYFRKDVSNMYDISEEIARFYGYNNIKSTTLEGTHFSKSSDYEVFKKKVKNLMLGLGVTEILTSPFESPDFCEKLLLDEKDFENRVIKVKNPLGLETSLMRPLLESSVLKVLKNNFSYKNKEVYIFEIAKEYGYKEGSFEPEEKEKLVAAFYGKSVDFFYIKGILEEFFRKINLLGIDFSRESNLNYFHPGICAKINSKNGINFGVLGKINPLVLKKFGAPENTYLFKLDVNKIFKYRKKDIHYKEIPHCPAIERDISFSCDEDKSVEFFRNIIKTNAGEYLESLKLFDIYRGDQVVAGKKSLAFNLVFRAKNRTLKEKEVDSKVSNIMLEIEKNGGKIRA